MKKIFAVLVFFCFCISKAQESKSFKFDEDLILYLPLNGDLKDLSPLKNNCLSSNIAPEKDKDDNTNGAFSFENNGYIEIEDVSNFNELTSFTLSSWVYLKQYNEHNNIISKVNPGRDFNLQITQDGILNFHLCYNDYIHFYSEDKIPLCKWTHVAFSYDGKRFQMYINGKPEKFSINQGGQFVKQKALNVKFLWTGVDLTIGNLYPDGWEYFRGNIDEVRIYKKALSAKEITQLYKTKNNVKGITYPLGDFNTVSYEPTIYKTVIEFFPSDN